jgi:RNA polymerase sigma factor (sigma-70 family)
MRVHESVVLGARLGSRSDFDAIAKGYGSPLYGFAVSELGSGEAEDAVQEILLKVFLGIKGLRETGRFEAWLWSIARNELRSRRRARALRPEFAGVDPDSLPDASAAQGGLGGFAAPSSGNAPGAPDDEVAELLAALSPGELELVRLRYRVGLSVRETALVEDIPERLARSRLWEAMEKLRRKGLKDRTLSWMGPAADGVVGVAGVAGAARRGAGTGRCAVARSGRGAPPLGLKENVMDKVELYRNAAAAFEAIGLADQVGMALAARKGERWGEDVLRALGRTRGGAEFVKGFDAKLSMRELAEIVNCCDRFTEKRLVMELEKADPGTAEEIKRNMFVFEDFSLFDGTAMELLFEEVGCDVLALGLSGIGRDVRNIILGRLPAARRKEAEEAMARCDPEPERVRAAQEEAIAWAYAGDKAGRFARIERGAQLSGAPIFTLLKPGEGKGFRED